MNAENRSGQGSALVEWHPFLSCALFALLSTLMLAEIVPRYAPGLLRLDHMMSDVRIAYLSDRLGSEHPNVAIVSITEETLKDHKVRQPVDRELLARIVDAVDAAGAKVIGIDILSAQASPPDNQELLITAIKRARAKVVLAAGDQRIGLSRAATDMQTAFIVKAGRPAGFVNLATERDGFVRFKASAASDIAYPKSFAALLAEAAGASPSTTHGRIAWLLEPRDRSDTFLTIPAHVLLAPAGDPRASLLRPRLKDKVVLIGGMLSDIDRHLTPLTQQTDALQPGVLIHAHVTAELIDRRHVAQIEANSNLARLELAAIATVAFLVGWWTRTSNRCLLFGTAATVAIIAVDTFFFWYWRIILPFVLAVIAWFLGEFTGHYIGRWFGSDTARS